MPDVRKTCSTYLVASNTLNDARKNTIFQLRQTVSATYKDSMNDFRLDLNLENWAGNRNEAYIDRHRELKNNIVRRNAMVKNGV